MTDKENSYYYKNREKILQKQKVYEKNKHKNMTYAQKQKIRDYNRMYYNKVRRHNTDYKNKSRQFSINYKRKSKIDKPIKIKEKKIVEPKVRKPRVKIEKIIQPFIVSISRGKHYVEF